MTNQRADNQRVAASHRRVAIVAGGRTPFIKSGKAFAEIDSLAMAVHATRGMLDRSGIDPELIESVVFGTMTPDPPKPNLARELVFEAGLPIQAEAHTVASYCITGLRAVTVVADAISGGRIDVGLAGGVDSLTRASMDLFREPSTGLNMGEHMELTCKEWDIPRERQDEVVLASAAAWERGWRGAPTGPVDWGRVNVNGSSIAVGHPWAATGTRILTTLANEMKRRDARYGLVSICAAGAMAGAFLLSRQGVPAEALAATQALSCWRVRRLPVKLRMELVDGCVLESRYSKGADMKYKTALHQTDEGYGVSVPGLPGCWSQGKTEEEALANIETAIREYLSVVDDLLKHEDIREEL